MEDFETIDDGGLVGRMIEGNQEAARALVDRYARPLEALLRRSLGSGADIEDAFQQIWLRVIRSAQRYDPNRPFNGWLFSIAWNVVRDQWAASRPVQPLSVDQTIPLDSMSAETRVIERSRDEAVHAAVRALPPRMAEVILLRYFEELTELECSQRLEVPVGTIKSRTHRGLRRLRLLMKEGL